MLKVQLVAGARPNFMKIAPIYRASLAVPRVDCRIITPVYGNEIEDRTSNFESRSTDNEQRTTNQGIQ